MPVEAWDAFVASSLNGTLFHTLRFLDYHPPDRFAWDHAALGADEREPIALLPAAKDGSIWWSGAGASFGGPVLRADAGPRGARDAVAALVAKARHRGYGRIRVTPPPPLYEIGRAGIVREALVDAGFEAVNAEVFHSIPLGKVEPAELLSPTARRGAAKAEREDVVVREERAPEAFHELLAADRASLGKTPGHSAAELADLVVRLGPLQTLLLARREDRLVAGAWLLRANERVGLSFYVCQDREHRRLRATNLLMLRAMEWAAQASLAELDLGTSSVRGEINDGLCAFKEAHGGRRHLRETFERSLS